MTSFFEHQKLSFRKNYMRNLIQLASADGHLDEQEVHVLVQIAAKRNIKEWQLKELMADNSPFEVFIPESFFNKMNLLHDLMRLMYADGVVQENEKEFVASTLKVFDLPKDLMPELLIMFHNGPPDPESWREFTDSLAQVQQPKKFATIL